MRIIFLNILCFVVLGCAQNQNREAAAQACMQAVLKKDSQFGELRNHESEALSLSETIHNYVQNLAALDFKECPKEFEAAFEKHAQAWSAMASVTDHYKDLRGEMHVLFDKLEKSKDSSAFKLHLEGIWSTWRDIEAISTSKKD